MSSELSSRMPHSPDDTRSWLLRTAAVLVAGAAAVVLTAGLLVWTASGLMSVPEPPDLAGPTVVTAADGSEIARFTAEVDRRVIDLEDVSQAARDAVVAAEDAEFRTHTGVDLLATMRALWVNLRAGTIEQGGSTLTQQYVKNTYTGDDPSLRRKVEEALLSLAVERQLSKHEILERYLNTVYFGEGANGIEAAAQTYFDVPAAELDVVQSATLAQLLPAPSQRNPIADPEGAQARRDALLQRMGQLGLLTPEEVDAAVGSPVEVVERSPDPGRYPYVAQHVRRLLVEEYGEEEVLTGALRVTTTIRPQAMAALREAVDAQLPPQEDRPGVDAGALAVDPATGEVLAWYGGRSHDESQFDMAMQAQRRPGSTFKPIAYLRALEDGIGPDQRYDAPRSFDEGELCDPGWGPSNAGDSSYGSLPLREGLVRSVNTVLAQVGCDVGARALHDTAFRLGVRTDLEETVQLSIGGFGSNSTVADLAQVYATFANDGVQCPLRTINQVLDRDGEELPLPTETTPWGEARDAPDSLLDALPEEWAEDDEGPCRRMASSEDVQAVTDALQEVVAETTGTRAQIDRPQAGKTGTTDDEVDAWFAGYTPDLALVVRVGDQVEAPLADIAGFGEVQGGTIPALIWRDAARALLDGSEPADFPGESSSGDTDEQSDEEGTSSSNDEDRGDDGESPSPSPSPSEQPDDVGDEQPEGEGGGADGGGSDQGGDDEQDEEDDEEEEEEECGLLDLGCPDDGS